MRFRAVRAAAGAPFRCGGTFYIFLGFSTFFIKKKLYRTLTVQ